MNLDQNSLYKLKDWITIHNLHFSIICKNQSYGAIIIIEKYLDNFQDYFKMSLKRNINGEPRLPVNLDWFALSENPFAIHLLYKYRNKIHWPSLSKNPSYSAIKLLRENVDKIDWNELCLNRSMEAMELIEENFDKIDWYHLCKNSYAWHIIEKNIDKINYCSLSLNSNPCAIAFLEKNLEKINWYHLSFNTGAIEILKNNVDKIDFAALCFNYSEGAVELLEKFSGIAVVENSLTSSIYWDLIPCNHCANKLIVQQVIKDKNVINWTALSMNKSHKALELIEKNNEMFNKIDYCYISENPALFEINKKYLKERIDIFREELCIFVFHPRNEGRLWFIDE
jgi:hypothetical protein